MDLIIRTSGKASLVLRTQMVYNSTKYFKIGAHTHLHFYPLSGRIIGYETPTNTITSKSVNFQVLVNKNSL